MNNHRPSTQHFDPVIPPSCCDGANAARGEGLNMVTPAPDKLNRLLRTQDAAKIVDLSPRTLESYRRNGGGPPYVKIRDRAVRYALRDLLTWVVARKRTSTLDPNEEAIFVGKVDATKP